MPWFARPTPRRTVPVAVVAAVSLLLAAGCGSSSGGSGQGGTPSATSSVSSMAGSGASSPTAAGAAGNAAPASASATADRKVMVITEENEAYHSVIGSSEAPYLNGLAQQYGLATRMTAGYPTRCPSLAAYILLTSGSTHGICDDAEAPSHQLTGDNLFRQVAASGREWRGYAQSMPTPCSPRNTPDKVYVVRHAPAPYYVSEAGRCPTWDVPLGTPTSGAMHDAVAAGTLPAFSFVTPDTCHDMHGEPACSGDPIPTADDWLKQWIPQILNGPDYKAGKLVVIITWDEGNDQDNHIPALVISPTTSKISSATQWTHCSTLRTVEELLGLPLLGCAADAPSMLATFHLEPSVP
jgi:hypothetical protein